MTQEAQEICLAISTLMLNNNFYILDYYIINFYILYYYSSIFVIIQIIGDKLRRLVKKSFRNNLLILLKQDNDMFDEWNRLLQSVRANVNTRLWSASEMSFRAGVGG